MHPQKHPIPCTNGRAMGCCLWIFERKLTALLRRCTVYCMVAIVIVPAGINWLIMANACIGKRRRPNSGLVPQGPMCYRYAAISQRGPMCHRYTTILYRDPCVIDMHQYHTRANVLQIYNTIIQGPMCYRYATISHRGPMCYRYTTILYRDHVL